ncbi:hypothetical protein [Pedobacter alluvionis]|uniref:Uncharacterized protein n=1 Tax=Pedobacter alluvionis TaxID=475253 RepID=A0A497XY26_9SPHI|nr:hypothetical protein [Pedobacter alluvionis]RLJ75110.1 hypothetical protein BCL90_3458 [Pedobacter alluvionis]TFB30215.1 hypothetical protein E3V97_18780 [Pedobacter alluvionis]
MEKAYDLDTFAKILTDKGYSGYFHTQAAYPDKLKESIGRYLEACRNGTEDMRKPELLLNTYLQYNGESKPYINCFMLIKYHHETFELDRMEIVKKDQYGQLMKQSELTGLSVSTVPTVKEAIAMVNDELKQKTVPRKKGFGL